MERPITDVVFVCSLDKVPCGYTAITNCIDGKSAQLWKKVRGGEAGTRYLCYTNEIQKDHKLMEDMYIPGTSEQYVRNGYRIITDTVDGEEPMRHHQLGVKKVRRSRATMVIVDIVICQSKENVPNLYSRLPKVNGCRIAYRKAKYTPESSPISVPDICVAMNNLEILDKHNRTSNGGSHTEQDGVAQPVADSLSPVTCLPPFQPPYQFMPTLPPYSNRSWQQPQGSHHREAMGGYLDPPPPYQTTHFPSPTAINTSMGTSPSNHPYTSTNGPSYMTVLPYQMNLAAPAQITPFYGDHGGYMGGAAYDTNIGFGFECSGAQRTSYNPSLPPYTPYILQQPSQGYPPATQEYPPAQATPCPSSQKNSS